MPKTISSLPTGAINKTDNLITATDGSDELKRNTVDELLAEPNADISALQTENAELKAQIAEMEEEISEISSGLPEIQIGTVSFTDISGIGYYDVVVTFEKKFSEAPHIFMTMRIATTNVDYGNTTITACNRSTTGFTARFINNVSSTSVVFNPIFSWMAILP